MWLYNSLLIFIGLVEILLYINKQPLKVYNSKVIQEPNMLKINLNKLYLIIVFIPLLLISALRSINIGNDTDIYHYIFNVSMQTDFNDFISIYSRRWEKGFLIFTKFISSISDNPQLLIATSSIISLFFVGRFIYIYSKKPALSVFLFITMRFYYFFMSNIRQSIALSLILFSYDFIKKKKIIQFLLIILIASQFHTTAVLFLPAYFIDRIKYSKKYTYGLALITSLIFVNFELLIGVVLNFVPSKYTNYINTSYYTNAKNIANIANFAVTLFVLFLSYIFKYHNNSSNKSKISFYFLFLSTCIGLLTIKFGMLSRIQQYFYIFSIAIIPNILSKSNNKYIKLISTLIIVVCFFLYNWIILAYRPEWQKVYPYELFFE